MPPYVPSLEEQLIQATEANANNTKSAPVRSFAPATPPPITFQGFGPIATGGGWQFNRGMRFTTPATGPESDALAVGTGSIVFIPAAGADPPTLGLRFPGVDTPGLYAAGMPVWMPFARWVLYRGIDPMAVRNRVQALLAGYAPRLAAARIAYRRRVPGSGAPSAATLAQAFVTSPVQFLDGLPVRTGEAIGAGATAGAQRSFELVFTQSESASTLVQNPAYYFNFWRLGRLLDLSTHALGTEILRLDQGLEASGVMRFVSRNAGNDANTPFMDPTQPARSIIAALGVAVDGDTIVILDDAVYQEAEIVITQAVNITSAASLAAGQRHLGGELADATAPVVPPGWPTLQGPESYAAIREDMTTDQTFFPTAAAHRVVRFNVAAGAIASLTKVVIRHGGAREGAGIYIHRSRPVVVASCHLHRNIAYFNALHFLPFHGNRPHPFPGSGWFEEGSGGGIGLYRSQAIIWGNRIDRNLANYGAAIGLFASCYPLIAENYLGRNAGPDWFPGGVTVTDGGAIRVLQQSLRFDSQAALQAAVPPGTSSNPVLIPINAMYDPSEVADTSVRWIHLRANRIINNVAADDGGGVYATALTRIFSVGNLVSHNIARNGDGGGFRISTASVLRSINDTVADNTTQGTPGRSATGGGIACRCSSLYLLGTGVRRNTSHFAGAGLSFTATREGEVSDGGTARLLGYSIPTWDDQRRLGLGFTHGELMIEGTSVIENNTADHADTGKGGGLYAFRFEDTTAGFVADAVTIVIDNTANVLAASNNSAFVDHGNRPYRRIYLLDQTKTGTAPGTPFIVGDTELLLNPDFQHASP